MRRILDVLLGVVALAAGVCLISLLSNDCTHSIACMGSTTPMHAPSVTGRMLELVSLTVASAVLARTVWILRTTRRACAALTAVATPSVLASSVARTGIQRVRCVATSPAAAFCHGVLRPTVVIETAALETLSGLALDAVLLHEAAHVRHHDPLRRALRQAVRDVGCRSSLFEWWSRRAAVHEELRADAWAARRVGGPALARALLGLASTREITSMPAFSDEADARVTQLLGGRPRLPRLPTSALMRTGLGAVAVAAMVVCAALSSI
jgi:Zn-dependent protease with chaperone function